MLGNRIHSCCCGCSPHDFVFVSSLFYILVSFGLLFLSIFFGFALAAIPPLILLWLSTIVLWGNRYSVPCFYLPALIILILCAFLFCFFSICVIIYGAYILFIHHEGHINNEELTTIGMGLGTILVGLLFLAASIIFSYFVEVFYRAYLLLKERNSVRDHMPITMNEFSKLM